jgi:ribosomal protein L21E
MTNTIQIGMMVKIDAKALDDAGYEDMRRFHGKKGEVVGIGDVLPGLISVKIGSKYALFKLVCLKG